MVKYRWFNTSLSISLDELVTHLRKTPFKPDDEDSEGFRVQEKGRNAIHAQFIEKEAFVETINFPTGQEIEEKRIRVRVTDFHITKDRLLSLQIVNAPRTLTPFFSALSNVSAFGFSFEPVESNVMDWISALQDECKSLEVTHLECSGLQVSALTQARLAISGSHDIRKDFHKFLGNKNVVFEKAKCHFKLKDEIFAVELFKSGAAKVAFPEEIVVSALKRSLKRTLL